MVSALTLDRCHRLSSSTRCLIATCPPTCRCCILQPPQAPSWRPKCGQRGRTRCDDSRCSSVSVACSQLFLRRFTLALTCSGGSAPSTNPPLPSGRRATPCASRSSASISSQPSGRGGLLLTASSDMRRLSQAARAARRRSGPGREVLAPVRLLGTEGVERAAHQLHLLLV